MGTLVIVVVSETAYRMNSYLMLLFTIASQVGESVSCASQHKEEDSAEAISLFEEDLEKNVADIIQCKQEGVLNCRAVSINLDYLKAKLKSGDSIEFLESSEISMKLRRDPTVSSSGSESFSFSLADGGEAIVTVKANEKSTSVFATIKPVTGNVTYAVESCGGGCNVLYERDIGYFNQFVD